MRYTLGADVVIGALDGSDPHHERARKRFSAWHERGDEVSISAINLSEVLVAPAGERRRLQAAREAVAALGVKLHSPTEAVCVAAAGFRSRHPISLPDAYLLATAGRTGGSVVTFDRKVMRAAESERIPLAAPHAP